MFALWASSVHLSLLFSFSFPLPSTPLTCSILIYNQLTTPLDNDAGISFSFLPISSSLPCSLLLSRLRSSPLSFALLFLLCSHPSSSSTLPSFLAISRSPILLLLTTSAGLLSSVVNTWTSHR